MLQRYFTKSPSLNRTAVIWSTSEVPAAHSTRMPAPASDKSRLAAAPENPSVDEFYTTRSGSACGLFVAQEQFLFQEA